MVKPNRYLQAAALYVKGTELELRDGSIIWCQVLNDFEVSDARRQAAAARARYTLAMGDDIDSDEKKALEAAYAQRTREEAIEDLISVAYPEHLMTARNELEADADWKERIEIIQRSDDGVMDRPEEDPERKALEKVQEEYIAAIERIIELENERLDRQLRALEPDDLFKEYKKEWVERRAGTVGMEAYNLREVVIGARCCDGKRDVEGKITHDECNHSERAFEDEDTVRTLPDELYNALREKFDGLAVSVREAKN